MSEVQVPELPPHLDLDVEKLHSLPSEQQELFLITFTSDLVRYVESLDAETISLHQYHIKKKLIQIINLGHPTPTRIIRKNVGICFAQVFAKGNRKLLFESVNELTPLVVPSKTEKDLYLRHIAIHCLGAIYEAAGDSAINLSSFVCTTLLKALKSSSNYTGIRASIFRALGKVLIGVGTGIDENTARDVYRQARNAVAGDKSYLTQIAACYCLEKAVQGSALFDNSNDYDKLYASVVKALESSSIHVRRKAALCWSKVLCKSFSESLPIDSLAKPKKPKRVLKRAPTADPEDEEIERPDSPAPTKPITALSFSLFNILKQFSNLYCKPSTGTKTRGAIAIAYIATFRELGEGVIEQNYSIIARHFFNDVLDHPAILNIRYKSLLSRQLVKIAFEDVIGKEILGESAQLKAAKALITDILRDYPQTVKERPEPSKQALLASLNALASLIESLGDAFTTLAESCRDVLIHIITHPSYTVQIHAARCLKSFVYACPQHLLPCVTICMNNLNRELGQISSAWQTPRKCVGLANGLAAILSVSTDQPLYASVEVFSRLLSQATGLLKSSSTSDLRISSTQIQIAWILLGGLMTLGPNFVKTHTSQLLLLWKNALRKPFPKENMVQSNILQLSFLSHVRECALGCLQVFLQYNKRLLTVDVTKRLAAMLHNTTMFLATLPLKKLTDDISLRLSPSLQLYDFDLMIRRRVLSCYTKLISDAPPGSTEALQQSSILPFSLSCFALPEDYAQSSLGAAITSAAGNFESIWDIDDNFGFGVTTLMNGYNLCIFPEDDTKYWLSSQGGYPKIEQALLSPVGVGHEHDSVQIYMGRMKTQIETPEPPASQVVNSAIRLFSVLFPLQSSKIQESVLEQLRSFMMDSALNKDPARKAAIAVNVTVALSGVLKIAVKETSLPPGSIRSDSVETLIKDLLRNLLISPDPYIRNQAAQSIGRLSKSAGQQFTIKTVDEIIEVIVANREPSARAGCALALGHIYARLGGMAAGLHLDKILGVLNSLSSDPHPTVHSWALESISRLASSSGLNFSRYVSGTLGLISQLYISDTHNEEVASLVFSNLEVEVPTPAIIARGVGSIMNVLGPDLQENAKSRDLILTLISQLQREESSTIQVEALQCQEYLSLFAPNFLEFNIYVQQLQEYLGYNSADTRVAALDGIYNLIRRDANNVLQAAKEGLDEKLWLLLDKQPDNEVVRNIIRSWLSQTGLRQTEIWIQRCSTVLTKITMKKSNRPTPPPRLKAPGNNDLEDEDVAGLNSTIETNGDEVESGSSSQELLKWQTRTFAMDLIAELLSMVERDAEKHVESNAELALQSKVADVIRMAFSASTTGVVALRIRGLQIINRILKIFNETPDPEYPEFPLLQQHQAQISSALNPAFSHDSSPELAAEAVNVCATFVSAGIVTEIKQMTRILSLLSSALDSFSLDEESATIGELKGLSSNALVMVKMAVLSAWAELQVSSSERKYLADALKPKLTKLTPMWLSSLREFAKLRFEPDISMVMATSGPLGGDLDTMYASLNRETLLHFYQRSWLKLVEAIASLIDEDSGLVFDALDGKTDLKDANDIDDDDDENDGEDKPVSIPYRDEPVAFFFVLFGLAFEALVGRSNDSLGSRNQTLEILAALKKILRPSVTGNAIYQDVVFSETMDMFDRLVLTEGLNVQSVVVEIARNLCLEHPSARNSSSHREDDNLSEDIEQLFELTRIIVLVIAGLVPNLTEDKARVRHDLNDETVSLLSLSLSSLVDASAVFPSIIESDLHACILHIFTIILGTPSCQASVVPQSLPIFKRFISSLVSSSKQKSSRLETSNQLRTALARFLVILKQAQRRETEAAIPCEKNVLLASTILLTTASSAFAPDDQLLTKFSAELMDCLTSRLPSKVAASCTQSILLAPKRNATDAHIATLLLPQVLYFVAQPGREQADSASDTDDNDKDSTSPSSSSGDGLNEARSIAARALASFPSSPAISRIGNDDAAYDAARANALGIVLPTLLARADKEGARSYRETARLVLDVAGAVGSGVFGRVVQALGADARALLEVVVRQGGERRDVVESEEPAIELKMDFLGRSAPK